ncbi:hypothetical protein C4588_06170 [Candidatus Parcubacteria bacterium]|nr:MAG: hypothetical protein C4588_06170 [Candidatus Parcubacteria bacterium]
MPLIILKRIGYGYFKAVSDEDSKNSLVWPTGQFLEATIKGSKKARAYKELCCYKGSCKYIANMNFSKEMDSVEKVDILTKIRCGFVSDVIHDSKLGQVHFIPKSLSYAECDQKDAHEYIAKALDKHSELVGLSTDDYVRLLDDQK